MTAGCLCLLDLGGAVTCVTCVTCDPSVAPGWIGSVESARPICRDQTLKQVVESTSRLLIPDLFLVLKKLRHEGRPEKAPA